MTLVLSEVLDALAQKLRRGEQPDALDLYRLIQASNAVANKLGYDGKNDENILLDAINLMEKEEKL